MFRAEDRHWWYVGMQRITNALIGGLFPGRTDLAILDAGCGTGAVMQHLAGFGEVAGCDFSNEALGFCQQRGLERLSQASVTQLPFAGESFDLVTSFDVLCHRSIGNPHQGLEEFHRVLKPGGYILLRLPAYNWLQSRHDRAVHTVRRFGRAELRRALTDTGFRVVRTSYANMLLFPAALLKRLADRVRPGSGNASDLEVNALWQDRLLARFLFAEARWLSHHDLPFGLTVIAVGRKP